MTLQTDYSTIRGMDPSANWLLGPGYREFIGSAKDQPIPLLLELTDLAAIRAFTTAARIGEADQQALIPRFRSENPEALFKPGRARLVYVMRDWLVSVVRADYGTAEASFRQARKVISLSSPVAPPGDAWGPPFRDLTIDKPKALTRMHDIPGDAVIMVMIDDGIAFAHERFRHADQSTRLLSFWDMETPPGVIHTRSEINAYFAAATRNGVIDEDEVYRRAGYVRYGDGRHKTAALRRAHGTHVADLAAGADPADDETRRPIIAIQLPSRAIEATSGALLEGYLAQAILGALIQAHIFAPGRRIVFSISLGFAAGSHDGGGGLERLFDLVSSASGGRVLFALPSGNNQLSRLHAEIDLSGSCDHVEFDWRVLPDDRTESSVQIWMPRGGLFGPPAAGRMRVSVTEPGGATMTLDELGSNAYLPLGAAQEEDRFAQLDYAWDPSRWRGGFMLRIRPTARLRPDATVTAPAGSWRLRFERLAPLPQPVHAWIQRDDSIYGYPQRGRQSYFEHEDYQRFDGRGAPLAEDPVGTTCPVRRRSLVNAIATSRSVLTAGGYRLSDRAVAAYSAGGPTTPAEASGRHKPDALLPSEHSIAHFGVLAAGGRSGGRVAMNGTSVAAPHLARIMADAAQSGNTPDRAFIQARAIAENGSPPVVFHIREGWGRLTQRYLLPVDRL